jgi:hypothetical protein
MPDKSFPEARVFSPNTRFHALARRPGGMSRSEAISAAQARIDEMQPEFGGWLNAEINALGEVVKYLRSGTSEPAWIERALFHSNQLRDVGTTMGFELVSYVANTLSMILERIKAGADCNLASITCHMDALALVRQESYRHLRPDQVPELLEGLHQIAESVSIVPASGQK